MNPRRTHASRASGWATPAVYAGLALVLGITFPRFEHRFLPGLVSTMSAPAAMAVCSAIASGMIALTGIVFSLTFVMIQFSATAYSPRLVLWVARDPVMSHALGVFSATFLYALMVLAWVDRGSAGRVPFVSGWMVLALLLASMGMFIALIERIGLLQVNRMLIFTGDQGRAAIESLYPEPAAPRPSAALPAPDELPVTQTLLHSGRPLVVEAIAVERLVHLAREAGGVIRVLVAVGDTAVECTPLLEVRGAGRPLPAPRLREGIRLGDERTFEQDPKYAIRLVVDIAIKALSPAINDPTTAVQALDQIEDLLLRLGRRELDQGAFRDADGGVRLWIPFPSWEDFLLLALDEIRAYGSESVQVMRRMRALTRNLAAVLPPSRRAALRHWEERLEDSITRSFADDEEKRDARIADRQGLGVGQEENESPRTETPSPAPAAPASAPRIPR